jgi:hypothetical protein
MSPNLNFVQIWEGENRPKFAYEQIVENGVTAWKRRVAEGADPGHSWAITSWSLHRCPTAVHKPAVIPPPLTRSSKRSYPDPEIFHSGGKVGKTPIKSGLSVVSCV